MVGGGYFLKLSASQLLQFEDSEQKYHSIMNQFFFFFFNLYFSIQLHGLADIAYTLFLRFPPLVDRIGGKIQIFPIRSR